MRPLIPAFFIVSLLFSALASAAPFAYVTNFAGNDVSVIDITNKSGGDIVVAKVNVGRGPHSIVLNPRFTTRAYVTNSYDNDISVINTANNSEITTVPVGKEPRGIAVNSQGTRVYVVNSANDTVSVIDTAKNTVIDTVEVPSPYAIAVNHAGTKVYVTNSFFNTVSIIDTATNAVTDTINVGKNPQGIALNPTGTKVYVTNNDSNTVSVIETATILLTDTVNVGTAPFGIAINLEGTKAYVTNRDSVSVIDTSSNKVVATALAGKQLQFQGIAINSAGTQAYVATNNKNQITVIDLVTNSYKTAIDVGMSPLGMAITPINPDVVVKSGSRKLSRKSDTGSASNTQALVVAATSESISCVFNYFESNYPQYYAPANKTLIPYGNSTYRYYGTTDSLLVYNPTNDSLYGGYGYYGYGYYYGYYYLYAGSLTYWKDVAGCGVTIPPLPTCTAPQVLNASTNTCVTPMVTCNAPQVRDTATNTCYTPAVVCTAPQVRNASTNTCVTPACPTGQVRDASNNCGIPAVVCSAPRVRNAATNTCYTPYTIGDGGPAGGIVYYVYNGGMNGLEAQWNDFSSFPKGAVVSAALKDTYSWSDAVTKASSYGPGWHLPTKDELNKLYLQQIDVGEFYYDVNYWSSTETGGVSDAWNQSFVNGHQFNSSKKYYSRVRAVRAF